MEQRFAAELNAINYDDLESFKSVCKRICEEIKPHIIYKIINDRYTPVPELNKKITDILDTILLQIRDEKKQLTFVFFMFSAKKYGINQLFQSSNCACEILQKILQIDSVKEWAKTMNQKRVTKANKEIMLKMIDDLDYQRLGWKKQKDEGNIFEIEQEETRYINRFTLLDDYTERIKNEFQEKLIVYRYEVLNCFHQVKNSEIVLRRADGFERRLSDFGKEVSYEEILEMFKKPRG